VANHRTSRTSMKARLSRPVPPNTKEPA
jgi:hypothetical protein